MVFHFFINAVPAVTAPMMIIQQYPADDSTNDAEYKVENFIGHGESPSFPPVKMGQAGSERSVARTESYLRVFYQPSRAGDDFDFWY